MMSVTQVRDLVRASGLPCDTVYRTSRDALQPHLPMIVLLSEGHFVVVTQIAGDAVAVVDPTLSTKSELMLSKHTLRERWSGFAIVRK
jgi:ABC-type bacteriocin/lantibiotic exporter with double-glycine peptidase domain